jgi:Fic family protein
MGEPGQLCSDADLVALLSRNGLLQFDEIRRLAALSWTEPGSVVINPALVRHLHQIVTKNIFGFSGQFRPGPVTISGTGHIPPPAHEVPDHVDDMIRHLTQHWGAKPVQLCAYTMWRCNWIHPFQNGNGRATRGLSYLVFLMRLGYEPGGVPTFVDSIDANKKPYYEALDHADDAWKNGQLDVSAMEKVVSAELAKQLVRVVNDAGIAR